MKPRARSLAVAAAIAVLFAFVLPLQTFIPNVSNYDFGLGRLLIGQTLFAISLTAVIGLLLILSDRFVRGYLMPIVVALSVCVYLEAGPLSLGIPELNGELPAVLNLLPRKIWDGAIWLSIIVLTTLTFGKSRGWLHWVAIVVAVLGLCSLLDIRKDGEKVDTNGSLKDGELVLAEELVEAVEYSPTRNVLLFVLDSVPAKFTDMIMDMHPKLKEHFTGFSAYNNNIGMHARTRLGVPGIFTGIYYENGQDVGEYMMSSLGTNSFLQVYHDRGDAIYSMLDFMAYGFTNRQLPDRKPTNTEYDGLSPVFWRDATEIPNLSLASVTFFRIMPFAFKDAFLTREMRVRRNRGGSKGYDREAVLAAMLASRPISKDSRQMLAKFHTHGMHGPMEYPTLDLTVSNCFSRLARLMDVYKERGIYDKSFIVIAADHGSDAIGVEGNADRKASALLWVKPDDAKGEFREVTTPTSHSKIARLMRRAANERLKPADVDEILYTKDRLYRRYFREDHGCRDWIYHADGSVEGPKK